MKRSISSKNSIEGAAFADFIRSQTLSPRNTRYDEDDSFGKDPLRMQVPVFILILFVGIVVLRLFWVQVISGSYYKSLSDKNRLRTTVIHAPRGVIFDRNNTPLVFNTPGFRKSTADTTVLLTENDALSQLAAGKNLEIDSLRSYPYQEQFSHILGYIGQISKEELRVFTSYKSGDIIGKSGIERKYEHLLKGTDGKKLIEVDSQGNPVRTLGITDPTAGTNLYLTVDSKIQQSVFEAMKEVKKGAVIVSTPQGEILSIVSKPSFDPNLFTLGQHYNSASDSSYRTVSQILSDTDGQALLNRAISGTYPPGSTFKLITAAAGLEERVIDENFEVNDTGVLQVGAFSFANWYYTQYGKTEGVLNVVKALKRSNDIFFYKIAQALGVEKLSEVARKFGLGRQLKIDLPEEAEGLVPSREWKQQVFSEPWYLGDDYHYGIGQGFLLVTPLQVNAWTQVIANGGTLYQPRLIQNTTNTPIRKNIIGEKTVGLIRQGMIESCSPGGVAWPLFEFRIKNLELRIDGKNFLEVPASTESAGLKDRERYREIVVACKTGTAEHGGKDTLPHAWITLFAPAYNPQIVVTVLSESSGEGSNVAAPIAKKILEAWFGR